MKIWLFAVLGGVAGLVGSFIPWGAPERLHGVGLPVAAVLWDAPNGTMIDYPNPLAYILNPVLGLLCGCLIFGFARLVVAIIRK